MVWPSNADAGHHWRGDPAVSARPAFEFPAETGKKPKGTGLPVDIVD